MDTPRSMSSRERFIREDLDRLEEYDQLCRKMSQTTIDTEIKKIYDSEVNWNLMQRVKIAKQLMRG